MADNSPVAVMTVRVVGDKSQSVRELKKLYGEVQQELNSDVIKIKVGLDDKDFISKLKELASKRPDIVANLKLESGSKEVKKAFADVQKGLKPALDAIKNAQQEISSIQDNIAKKKAFIDGKDAAEAENALRNIISAFVTSGQKVEDFEEKILSLYNIIQTKKGEKGEIISPSSLNLVSSYKDIVEKIVNKATEANIPFDQIGESIKADEQRIVSLENEIEKASTVVAHGLGEAFKEVEQTANKGASGKGTGIGGISEDQIKSITDALGRLETVLTEIKTTVGSIDFSKINTELGGESLVALTSAVATIADLSGKISDNGKGIFGIEPEKLEAAVTSVDNLRSSVEKLFDLLNTSKNVAQIGKGFVAISKALEDSRAKIAELEAEVADTGQIIKQAENPEIIEAENEALKKQIELFQESNGQFSLFDGIENESKEVLSSLARIADEADELKQSVLDIPGQIELFEYLSKAPIEGQINIFDWIEDSYNAVFARLQRLNNLPPSMKEWADAQKRILNEQISNPATVEWIRDLEKGYELAGEAAEEAAQKMQEAIQVSANADAGSGIETLFEALSDDTLLIEQAEERLKAASWAMREFSNSGKSVKTHKKEFGALLNEYKEAEKALSLLTNKQKTEASTIKELEKEYNALEKAEASTAAKAEANTQKRIKAIQSEIDKLDTYIVKMQESGNADLVQERFASWEAEFTTFKSSLNFDNISSSGLDALESKIKELKNETVGMGEAVKIAKKNVDGLASDTKIDALIKRMDSFKALNERLSQTRKDKIADLIAQLQVPDVTVSKLREVAKEFGDIEIAAAKAGETGANWFDGWKKRLTSLSQYLTTFVSFYRIVGYVREAFDTINELDYALIDLRKTTTMTNEELEEFYHNSVNVGKQVGTTAKDIIDQAAAWSRLGYQTKEEATAMAELSAQFAAISPGMALDKATDGLVSTMKAFHIDVDNVEKDVMDSINRIGNTMATSNEEVVEMLTRSSAAMNAANNSLAETIALESAAVQITRNAETTGTAFRTENCPYVQQCA